MNFINCPNTILYCLSPPFSPSSRAPAAFGYHVFLVSFSLEQFLSISLSWSWHFWGYLFCRISLNLGLSEESSCLDQIIHVWWEFQRRYVLFSVHHIGRHMIWTCPNIGDVNMDQLVKVVFTSFLHCQVTIFPFLINK